jgi:hypothetical protein
VDLAALASETWRTVRPAEASLEREEAGLDLLADEGRLRLVLANLFHDAVQHGEDPRVRVGFDDVPSVADDAPGRSGRSVRLRLLDARGSNGDGLAIVRSIVEAHGREIEAGESAQGGARFDISGVEIDACTPGPDADRPPANGSKLPSTGPTVSGVGPGFETPPPSDPGLSPAGSFHPMSVARSCCPASPPATASSPPTAGGRQRRLLAVEESRPAPGAAVALAGGRAFGRLGLARRLRGASSTD